MARSQVSDIDRSIYDFVKPEVNVERYADGLTPEELARRQQVKITGTGDGTVKKQPFRREKKKVGRNDPCPCGSGLKYKKCCGKNET